MSHHGQYVLWCPCLQPGYWGMNVSNVTIWKVCLWCKFNRHGKWNVPGHGYELYVFRSVAFNQNIEMECAPGHIMCDMFNGAASSTKT